MTVDGWGDCERTVIASPQPSAGGGFTVGLQESEEGTLVAVTFRLVTSATVATRTPVVSVTDGTGAIIVGVAAGYGATANSTADYSFVAGIAEWDQSNNEVASGPLAPFPLRAGDNIVVTVGAVDATDQISRIRITMMQHPVRKAG